MDHTAKVVISEISLAELPGLLDCIKAIDATIETVEVVPGTKPARKKTFKRSQNLWIGSSLLTLAKPQALGKGRGAKIVARFESKGGKWPIEANKLIQFAIDAKLAKDRTQGSNAIGVLVRNGVLKSTGETA